MSEDVFADGDPFKDPHWQKKTKPRRRARRHIGCPVPWFAWVFPLVKSKDQLGLVLYLYRRCCLAGSNTVAVPNDEIAELLDISRWGKSRLLRALEQAGILQIVRDHWHQTVKVRLW